MKTKTRRIKQRIKFPALPLFGIMTGIGLLMGIAYAYGNYSYVEGSAELQWRGEDEPEGGTCTMEFLGPAGKTYDVILHTHDGGPAWKQKYKTPRTIHINEHKSAKAIGEGDTCDYVEMG